MIEYNLKLRADMRPISDFIDLYMFGRDESSNMIAAMPVNFHEYDQSRMVDPFVQLSVKQAQELMNELWRCGLRPSEGSGSAGSLKATQEHLNDMRKIVFMSLDKLGIGPRRSEE